MSKKLGALDRMRAICLALPETKETLTWGKPHFRVGEKIFAGFEEEKGKPVAGFKLSMPHAHSIIENPRFWPAPYVGHRGWVSMDLTGIDDWDSVRQLILESYRLIAPKRVVKLLDGGSSTIGAGTRAARTPRKAVPKSSVAKTSTPRKKSSRSKKAR